MPTAPTVFISYNHKDGAWKDRLLTHLRISQREGLLELWDDRRIAIGTEWRSEIEKAIDTADVGILLISADFLVSEFILGKEIPRMLERRSKDGMRLIPVLVRSCDWQIMSWLEPIQIRPRGARPLADFRGDRRDAEMAAIAREVRSILELKTAVPFVSQTADDSRLRHISEEPAIPVALEIDSDARMPTELTVGISGNKSLSSITLPLETDHARQKELDVIAGQVATPRRGYGLWLAIGLVALLIGAVVATYGAIQWKRNHAEQQHVSTNVWADVEKRVSPAVVHIDCRYRLRIPKIILSNSTAALSTGEALLWGQVTGSGVLIRSGLVLTAKHIVEPWRVRFNNWGDLQKGGAKAEYDDLDVQFAGQQPLKATIIASSSEFDLALIKIQIQPIAVQEVPVVASNREVQATDHIAVISYPATFSEKLSQAFTTDFSRITPTFVAGSVTHPLTGSDGPNFLVFDAALTHGSSGGAVVNDKGELIGIVSQAFQRSEPINLQGLEIKLNEPIRAGNLAVSPDDIRIFLRGYGVL